MSGAPYSEANRAVLAWGAQRPVPDLGPSADSSTSSKEKRQLSDFYGVDEPSFNSFVYAQNNPSIPAPPTNRFGLARPAQRSVSQYDRAYGRPRPRPRRQPATMPAASFAEIAASDGVVDRSENPLPAPKMITRSDSLLNRARRVLSLPNGRRSRRLATAAGNGTPPTPPQHDLFERRPERVETLGRSHLSHSSRRGVVPPSVPTRETSGAVHATGALEERIKALEAELEIQKLKNEQQQKRLEELEKEVENKNEALPALESIIQTAMKSFEAKENALKRTITTLDRDFTNAMAEKNESMRLYDGYDDRDRPNRASPPASISTVSESDGSGYHLQVSRRVQSLDTHRRSGSPSSRSLFTHIEFDINR